MPRIVDKEKKRKQIAKAAIDIFAWKGFEQTTIQEIADAAGIGKGTFYEYYETKEDIMGDIARELFRQSQELVDNSYMKIKDPREKLILLINESLRITEDVEGMTLVYMELWLHNKRKGEYIASMKFMEEVHESQKKLFSMILKEGVDAGIYRTDIDCDAMAKYIMSALDGIAMHHMMIQKKFDVQTVSDEFMKCLFNGILLNPDKVKSVKAGKKAKGK
jgi:AcrR family transcriptional regulator